MNRLRARRMRWLVATFASTVGVATLLRWGAAQVGVDPPRHKNAATANRWLVANGVAYRPIREVSVDHGYFRQTYRANVEARDPGSGDLLWTVTVREGETRPGVPDLPDVSPEQFALKLSARGRDIAAETPDGGVYLLDTGTRRVSRLKAPTPPICPVLDARLPGKTRCEVHDLAFREDVVPIRYGYNSLHAPVPEVQTTRFPYASPSVAGGCVVGTAREARVLYCPGCREAGRERLASPAAPATDEGHPVGVN